MQRLVRGLGVVLGQSVLDRRPQFVNFLYRLGIGIRMFVMAVPVVVIVMLGGIRRGLRRRSVATDKSQESCAQDYDPEVLNNAIHLDSPKRRLMIGGGFIVA